MFYKRIRRTVLCICSDCLGSGFQATNHGPIRCTNPDCRNGDVEKVVVEFVRVEDEVSG